MKKQYIAPDLTAVVFRAERGFAVSSPIDYMANRINDQIEGETGLDGFGLVNGSGWGYGNEDQVVNGYNNGEDHSNDLAAGYFGQQDASGWFN